MQVKELSWASCQPLLPALRAAVQYNVLSGFDATTYRAMVARLEAALAGEAAAAAEAASEAASQAAALEAASEAAASEAEPEAAEAEAINSQDICFTPLDLGMWAIFCDSLIGNQHTRDRHSNDALLCLHADSATALMDSRHLAPAFLAKLAQVALSRLEGWLSGFRMVS